MNKIDLKSQLDDLNINPHIYNLEGSICNPGTVLFENYGKWEIIVAGDKGEQTIEKVFKTESEACEFLLEKFIEFNKIINSTKVVKPCKIRDKDSPNIIFL
jgi:hypothetical protein